MQPGPPLRFEGANVGLIFLTLFGAKPVLPTGGPKIRHDSWRVEGLEVETKGVLKNGKQEFFQADGACLDLRTGYTSTLLPASQLSLKLPLVKMVMVLCGSSFRMIFLREHLAPTSCSFLQPST